MKKDVSDLKEKHEKETRQLTEKLNKFEQK